MEIPSQKYVLTWGNVRQSPTEPPEVAAKGDAALWAKKP